jgi:tRNA-splicing ligase RtcB
MGRKEAIRSLDINTITSDLDARRIVHSIRNVNDLDEAPQAYKDIDVVMASQVDLVDITTKLTPLGVING